MPEKKATPRVRLIQAPGLQARLAQIAPVAPASEPAQERVAPPPEPEPGGSPLFVVRAANPVVQGKARLLAERANLGVDGDHWSMTFTGPQDDDDGSALFGVDAWDLDGSARYRWDVAVTATTRANRDEIHVGAAGHNGRLEVSLVKGPHPDTMVLSLSCQPAEVGEIRWLGYQNLPSWAGQFASILTVSGVKERSTSVTFHWAALYRE